jgi:hypothetical protein
MFIVLPYNNLHVTKIKYMKGNNYTNLTFVTATDQNGDNIFLFLNNDTPSGLSIENVTGALSWIDVPDLDTASLIITASDGTATSIWTPQIKYCKCQVSIYDDQVSVIISLHNFQ